MFGHIPVVVDNQKIGLVVVDSNNCKNLEKVSHQKKCTRKKVKGVYRKKKNSSVQLTIRQYMHINRDVSQSRIFGTILFRDLCG